MLSRKGNFVMDGAIFIIALFVIGMISFFGLKLLNDLSPDINADLTHNESIDAYSEVEDRYPSTFTGLIIFCLIGFWTFCIVAGLMSTHHPLMFIFSIILILFIIIISMVLGNFYEEFFDDAEYGTLTSSMPIPHFILTHMLEISIVILMSSVLIAFAKSRTE